MSNAIRIVSDGTSFGTHVFSATGERLKNITSIQILPIVAGELVKATITFVGVEMEITAKQESDK